jgi:hypothetical protein
MRVERIRHRHRQVESVVARARSGERFELEAPYVISTMPIRDLIAALDPAAPAEVRRAADQLRYRDYLTVVLIVKRQSVFPDNWLYVHSPEVKLGRVQNYKNWSPAMVPDPYRTSLGLEYFLWDEDEQWSWPAERLIEMGISDCVQIGLIERAEVEDGTVVRVPKAYPVYDQHYREHLATVRRYLETFENLQTVGRNGQHRYNNQDHSMLTGMYAARNLTGAHYDVWSVNTEAEYLEERRVPTPRRAAPVAGREVTAGRAVQTVFAHLDPVALGIAVGTVSGILLFLATVILLLKGGPVVGPRLGLLRHYFIGFTVTWAGAFVALLEAGVVGFILGFASATLRNWMLAAYATLLKRRALAAERRDLLGRM